jgi:hypothetical protein
VNRVQKERQSEVQRKDADLAANLRLQNKINGRCKAKKVNGPGAEYASARSSVNCVPGFPIHLENKLIHPHGSARNPPEQANSKPSVLFDKRLKLRANRDELVRKKHAFVRVVPGGRSNGICRFQKSTQAEVARSAL